MKKLIITISFSMIAILCKLAIIQIEHTAALPQNLYNDYDMNGLPFHYLLWFCLLVLAMLNFFWLLALLQNLKWGKKVADH